MSRHLYVFFALLLVSGVLSIQCASSRTTGSPGAPEPVTVSPPTDPEETAVRNVLNDVELAMEQRDVYRVLAHVSASYRDKMGRDYTDLRRLLQRVFDHYASIEIARSGTEVTIDENRAAVTENFVTFARGKPGTNASPFTLKGLTSSFLEKIAGRWLIVEWGESL